jgi:phosphoglycerate dehydrogenase-like enzyme
LKKIVLADRETEKMGIPELLQGYAQVILPKTFFINEDDFVRLARDADAIITVLAKVEKKVIESAEKLKIIAVAAAGYDNVDVSAATSKRVFVTRAATAHIGGVAEHALGLMIVLSKKIFAAIEEVRKGNWDFRNTPQAIGKELGGKIVGIIGLGNVGVALAKKIHSFGLQVLAYDPYVTSDFAKSLNVNLVSLTQLLQQSDYVCITCALTKETWHLIGEKELKIMKKDAFLVSVARGGIINEMSLYQALSEGWIAGAGLDVLELEPPPEDFLLLRLNNCIITPHIAGLTIERYGDCGRLAVEEVKKVLEGDIPNKENLVNPEILNIAKK